MLFSKYILLGIASLSIASFTHAESKAPHWAYGGEHGAANWAHVDATFETCTKGLMQSPINIQGAVKADLPALQANYDKAAPTIVNNGHTIQVNLPAGQKLVVGDQTYELLQFHFHTPSEEQINGKHTAMVAHFVHKNGAGALGVVAVLIEPLRQNAPASASSLAFSPIFAHLPREGEKITVDDLALDLAAMLPTQKGYYSFSGSLTTPPCSEGVNWMVLKQPVTLKASQIKAFRRLYNANARPIQPLNGRVIQESK